ncbi:TonB-dependent receptor [Occallatibacter savannae]|uniref:TonB-dependent receptor n=1 Tax=Occallatibacter savannae TaxID=1002691 RepID=UPI000D687E84|nr:TonB-dependent receptor [Occallatibacter savannae]
MNRLFWRSVSSCSLALLTISLLSLPGLSQQTLGSLNGTVTDSSGAAVPGARITITNAATNYSASTVSQETGFYQVFNLPIGTYTVKVSHAGFDTMTLKSVPVQEAKATTVNASLRVGQVSETVEVTATPLLNATDTTNGYTLDSAQIDMTPLATGSFTQIAVLSPGVNAELLSNLDSNAGLGNQPIWANGQRDTSNTFQVDGVDSTNLFNGKSSSGSVSQRYNFNIGSYATVGGAFSVGTSVYGSNGNSLPSPPPEFMQELRVNASMYDAQQGATSGAQIDVNTATGTNNWHGQMYGSFANNAINSAPYFFKQSYALAQGGVGIFPRSMLNPYLNRWAVGGTIGGPLAKDKLFLFAAFQHRSDSDRATGFSQMTVPSGLTNDRSLAGLQAADLSWGAESAPSSIDPVAQAILQAKLPNGQYLIPSAQTSAPYQYGIPNVNLIGTSVLTSNQGTLSLDYDLTKRDRLSTKYFYQDAPVTKPYGYSQTGGFPVTQLNGSQVAAIDNTIAISPKLNWEQRFGFVRMGSYAKFKQTVAGGTFGVGSGYVQDPNSPGYFAPGLPGITLVNFGNSSSYSPSLGLGPASSFTNMGYYQNRLNPSTNLIWVAGKHTVMAGGGYSYTQLNITNNRDGNIQMTVNGFDAFLKGEVRKASVVQSIDPQSHRNNGDRYYRTNELSGYVQDKWQILSNLSLTAGVRYDYHGGMTEKYGNMFNFNPALFDVTGDTTRGFVVNNAGFEIAGNNRYHPTPGVSNSTLKGRQWGISPRVGFAWSPAAQHGNLVIRGGSGIYFDRGELFTYLSQPAGGDIGGPFGVTESAPLVSYANGDGGTLADPMGTGLHTPTSNPPGSFTRPSSDPGTVTQALQQQLDIMTGPASDPQYGRACGGIDSQTYPGYLDCTPTLNFGSYDRNNVLPYTINYTLNVEWQPRNDLAITVGFTGNRGRHSVIPLPLNEPGLASPQHPIWGETGNYGFEVLNQNSLYTDSYGYEYYNPIQGEPWNTYDGGNTDFRAPFIGFNPNAADFKTVGVSAYDALETHVEKRLSHHFQVGGSYTWSHALDEQSDIGLFFTGDDPLKLRDSWASADYDRTHVFSANFQVEVPNMAKAHSLASYITNDWHVTGQGILQSGQPYSLYEFYGSVGSLRFGDYPNLMNPVLGIKDPAHPKSAFTHNKGSFRDPNGSYIPTIDPTQIAIHYLQPGDQGIPVSTGTDPQDIYETAFNVGQRNIFRQSAQKRLDMSLRKTFHAGDRISLQYELNAFNITNTPSLDVPQNQAQIRQPYSCSNTAIQESIDNYLNCTPGGYYINYGQLVTSPDPADQESTRANLDQLPYSSGTGKGTRLPLTIPVGQGICNDALAIPGTNTCPNNAANFGSATGTIGGNRAFTMGVHIIF